MKHLLLAFFLLVSVCVSAGSPNEGVDPKIAAFHKVHTVKVSIQEPEDESPVLQYILQINAEGQVVTKKKVPMYEDEDTVVTTYEYMSGKLVREFTEMPEQNSTEVLYFYRGKAPVRKIVKSYETKDYEIFSDDQGVVLGMIGKGMIAEKDSITGDLTGKMVEGNIDEYEFRYNRFMKMTKETYYYFGNEFYRNEFDYGPNSNAPLQKSITYKNGNKTPDTETLYSYLGSGLVEKIVAKDLISQSIVTTLFEYEYKSDSPSLQKTIYPQSGPNYSPLKRK